MAEENKEVVAQEAANNAPEAKRNPTGNPEREPVGSRAGDRPGSRKFGDHRGRPTWTEVGGQKMGAHTCEIKIRPSIRPRFF